MIKRLYENSLIYVEVEPSSIAWLKIFVKKKTKEFSSCDKQTKIMVWNMLDLIEKHMLKFFKCDKINIASFGNYLPQVHFHIMTRFKNDDYFPEPMWGIKQRDGKLKLTNLEQFYKSIKEKLTNANL